MRTILLSLVLFAAATTAANANIYVWWEIDSATVPYAVTDHGPGHTLVVEDFVFAPGEYTFNLSMWIATDGTGGTVNGMTLHRDNLWRGADTSITMGNDPLAGNLNPLGWTGSGGYTPGSQNSGDALIMNWGRGRHTGGQVAATAMRWFEVALVFNATDWVQYGDTSCVYQSVGTTLYGWAPTAPLTLNKVFFGANPWVYGNTAVNTFAEASDTELPVIIIQHNIPEPAAMALLAFGLTMLLRRR